MIISDLEIDISKYIWNKSTAHYSDLEKNFEISKPTISKYLSNIASYVDSLGINLKLVRDRGKGIYFVGKRADFEKEFVYQDSWNPITPKDRRMYILASLLFEKRTITISELTGKLFVSQRSIENDLAWLRKFLADNNGALINNSGYLRLKMPEDYLYAFMIDVFHNYWGEDLNQSNKNNVILPPILSNFFSKETAERIFRFVDQFLEYYHFRTTEYEYTSLVIYLLIQYTLFSNSSFFLRDRETEYHATPLEHETDCLASSFEEKFQYIFSADQKRFLNNFVILIKLENSESLQFDEDNEIEAIKKLIIGPDTHVNIYDDQFLDGVSKHISMAIKRIKFGMHTVNPYTENFKRSYPLAFEEALELSSKIQQKFDVVFKDNEIAYIGMYFESFSERKGIVGEKVSAAIVCNSGIGTAKFLEEKINQNLHDSVKVKAIYTLHELPKENIATDIIISTVALLNAPKPAVLVTPFLNASDRESILELVSNIKQANLPPTPFKELLRPDLIVFNETGSDYQAVLKQITTQAVDLKLAKDVIFQAAVKRELLSSTAIDGIALPHSTTDYVEKPFIGIIKSQAGIDWLGTTIHLAFFMGLKGIDTASLKKIYHQLNKLVENKPLINQLLISDDPQEIIDLLGANDFD